MSRWWASCVLLSMVSATAAAAPGATASLQRWTVVAASETPEDELSILFADRRRAARGLPLELDVQLVKSQPGGRDRQVIGVADSNVWVVDLDRQVAQVRKLGKVYVPDHETLERIGRSLAGARLLFAFEELDPADSGALPVRSGSSAASAPSSAASSVSAGDVRASGKSVSKLSTLFVTADDSLYRIRLDATLEPAVQRMGSLKKAFAAP